jgi:hypothetical protein
MISLVNGNPHSLENPAPRKSASLASNPVIATSPMIAHTSNGQKVSSIGRSLTSRLAADVSNGSQAAVARSFRDRLSGLYEAAVSVPPTGYAGMVDVLTIMSGIASLAGWNFHNDGVTDKMENVYYPGTPWDQMQQVAEHANINAILDDGAPKRLSYGRRVKRLAARLR